MCVCACGPMHARAPARTHPGTDGRRYVCMSVCILYTCLYVYYKDLNMDRMALGFKDSGSRRHVGVALGTLKV